MKSGKRTIKKFNAEKEFNEASLASIRKDFLTIRVGAGNQTADALLPLPETGALILDNEEKKKELLNNLLVDVFGTGAPGMIDAAFLLFQNNDKKHSPDFSFVNEKGFDIVKSAIFGGNVDVFKIACNKVGIDNIRDKDLALSFATERNVSDIKEILEKEKQDKIQAKEQKEAEERVQKAIKNKAKRDKQKAKKSVIKNTDLEKKDEELEQIISLPETFGDNILKNDSKEEIENADLEKKDGKLEQIISLPETFGDNILKNDFKEETEEKAKKAAIKKAKKMERREERRKKEQYELKTEIASNESENLENETQNSLTEPQESLKTEPQETFYKENYDDDLNIDECLEEFSSMYPEEPNPSSKMTENSSENKRTEPESHKSTKEESASLNIKDASVEFTLNITAKEFIPQQYTSKTPSSTINNHEKKPLDDKNNNKGSAGNSRNI